MGGCEVSCEVPLVLCFFCFFTIELCVFFFVGICLEGGRVIFFHGGARQLCVQSLLFAAFVDFWCCSESQGFKGPSLFAIKYCSIIFSWICLRNHPSKKAIIPKPKRILRKAENNKITRKAKAGL